MNPDFSPKPRGNDYIETLEKLINYQELAAFLYIEADIIPKCNVFLDMPCGTGKLLQVIQKHNWQIDLIGLEKSAKQLAIARANNPNITLIRGDVFFLDRYLLQGSKNRVFCHIGSCFFNTIDSLDRLRLLTAIYNSKIVKNIAIEIQNVNHQEKNFISERWYKTSLTQNLILLSRSIRLPENKKLLDMCFYGQNGVKRHSELLFDWPLETCIDDLNSIGWRNVQAYVPSYRKNNSDINSHWVIIAKR